MIEDKPFNFCLGIWMNEIDVLICGAQIHDYSDWKSSRLRLIKSINPILMTLNEKQINSIFESWAIQIKERSSTTDTDSIIHILLLISLVSYFHRDHDSIKPIIPFLNKLLQKEDELIVNITSKLLALLSSESVEGTFLFNKPFSFVKSSLQSQKYLFNALIILKRARKISPADVIHFVFQSFKIFFEIGVGDNPKLKPISLKLIRFLLQRIYIDSDRDFLNNLRNLLEVHILKSIPILVIIFDTHSFIFTQSTVNLLFLAFFTDNATDEGLDLLLQICEKTQFTTDNNLFVKKLMERKNNYFLNRAINCFKRHLDPDAILPYLQSQCENHICDGSVFCPFFVLKSLLKYFPDVKLNTKNFAICENFISCIAIRPDLIDLSILPKYINLLLTTNDDSPELHLAFMLCRTVPDHFPNNPLKRYVHIFSLNFALYSKIRFELIKTAAIYDNEDSNEILKSSVLYDSDKKVRFLALKSLNPSSKLAHSISYFQLLADSSFRIRRKAIKLFSELIQYNPLEITPIIQLYTNHIVNLLLQTPDFHYAAKVASVLPYLCKYCSEIIEPFANILIEKIFIILDAKIDAFPTELISNLDQQNTNDNSSGSFTPRSSSSDHSFESLKKLSTDYHFSLDSNQANHLAYSNTYNFQNTGFNIPTPTDEIHFSEPNFRNESNIFNKTKIDSIFGYKDEITFQKPIKVTRPKEDEPLKSRIYLTMNEEFVDKRNAHLCRALANLGMLAEPYLTKTLNAIFQLLDTRKNEELYVSLVKSLRIICKLIYNGLNIRLRCPQLAVPLSKILSNTTNEKLAISILKLFGSAFDSVLATQSQYLLLKDNDSLFVNTTDFVMDNILTHFKKPSLPLFAALTMIIEGDPENSTKYLTRIIPLFLSSINKSSVFRDTLFEYLEIIASKCHIEFNKLLPNMMPTILNFLNLKSCVKLCTVLSYSMKIAFIPYAGDLYIPSISKMNSNDESYFKSLCKFITFMTYFQNQPFELFMHKIETEHFSQNFLKIISNSLITLVQSNDLRFHQARLLFFTRKYFDPQLLFSLCVFCDLPAEQLKRRFVIVDDNDFDSHNAPNYSYLYYNKFQSSDTYFAKNAPLPSDRRATRVDSKEYNHPEPNDFNADNPRIRKPIRAASSTSSGLRQTLISSNITKPALTQTIYDKLKNHHKYSQKDLDFLKLRKLKVKIRSIMPQSMKPTNFFNRFSCPTEMNILKWMISLYQHVVKRSPSNSIRSCISLTSLNEEFMKMLFPVAFLSCWKATNEEDRNHFSSIVEQMLKEFVKIHPLITEILVLCDRAQIPMNIDRLLIAKRTDSNPIALYYIEKKLIDNPNDINTIDILMEQFLKMGFHSSVEGLFNRTQKFLDNKTLARWSGYIGNWERSLEIYTKENADFTTIINCLAKLNRYDEIASKFEIFESLEKENKNLVLDAFFNAYSDINGNRDDKKLQEIIEMFDGCWTSYRYILAINFYISTNQYKKASKLTKKALEMMANDRGVFLSGNYSQIVNNLNSAQLFIDCKEVLNIKKLKKNTIWKQRVKGFKRDEPLWEQIITLKNNVVPIKSNLPFYAKVISALRKDRYFGLIDRYFQDAFFKTQDPRFFIVTLKISWAKGNVIEATKSALIICRFINGMTFEEFKGLKLFPWPTRYMIKNEESQHFTDAMRKECCSYFNISTETGELSEHYKEFIKLFKELDYEEQEKFFIDFKNKYTENVYKCLSEFRSHCLTYPNYVSRLNRTTGTFLYKTSETILDTKECLRCIGKAMKLAPNDYRNWKTWGYANVRMFNLLQESRPIQIQETINYTSDVFSTSPSNEKLNLENEIDNDEELRTNDGYDDDAEEEQENSQIYTIKREESIEVINNSHQKTLQKNEIMHGFKNNTSPPEKKLKNSASYKSVGEYTKILNDDDILTFIAHLNPNVNVSNNKPSSFTNHDIIQSFKVTERENNNSDNVSSHDNNTFILNTALLSPRSGLSDDDIHENIYCFANNAIIGFLKAAKLNPKNSLEYLCQMFNVLFSMPSSETIPQSVLNEIQSLPSLTLSKVIPQLTAKIAHPDFLIRNLVKRLIMEIGQTQFQSLYFTLNLYSRIRYDSVNSTKASNEIDAERARIASEILLKMKDQNIDLFNDVELFTDGIIRSAITWFETWIHNIELAAKAQKLSTRSEVFSILDRCIESTSNPKCELDALFLRLFGNEVKEIEDLVNITREQITQFQQENPSQQYNPIDLQQYQFPAESQLWLKLRQLHLKLKSQIDRLSVIVLSKISEPLAAKRGFFITCPGSVSDTEKVESVEPIMEIMGTQQKPRIVFLKTVTGRRVKYLLKGNEDLRLDERLMQFFQLVNEFFRQDRGTREFQAIVNRYAVIPLTTSSGLIQWVVGADTLHQIICDYRTFRNVSQYPENDVVRSMIDVEFINLNGLQRYEVFEEVAKHCKATEVFDWMWIKSSSPHIWLIRNDRYTVSLSLMSIVGYIIGLGDRHPSNIMIQRDTGDVVHIDFGESFESTITRSAHPEKVPFRLTRMLSTNLSGNISGGFFRLAAQRIMHVLQENKSSLVAQLAIFIHDPLTSSGNKHLIKRVKQKLDGEDFANEGIHHINYIDQIDRLIKIAEDPKNYVRHYPGWCPFW